MAKRSEGISKKKANAAAKTTCAESDAQAEYIKTRRVSTLGQDPRVTPTKASAPSR
jgi:hypothetical protein